MMRTMMRSFLMIGLMAMTTTSLAGAARAPTDSLRPPRATSLKGLPKNGARLLYKPGDTLLYTVSWTAVARATGYQITAGATPTTGWTNLPTNQAQTNSSYAFHPINTTAWDSVAFFFCVKSTRGTQLSTNSCAGWKLFRVLPPPGVITVDSSLIQTGLLVLPKGVTMVAGSVQQYCGMVKFANGKTAMRAMNALDPACVTAYNALPAAQRNVTLAQQKLADENCLTWSATGGTITQEACSGLGSIQERGNSYLLASWTDEVMWTPTRWRTVFRANGRVEFFVDPKGQWNRMADMLAERMVKARMAPPAVWLAYQKAYAPKEPRNIWEAAYGR